MYSRGQEWRYWYSTIAGVTDVEIYAWPLLPNYFLYSSEMDWIPFLKIFLGMAVLMPYQSKHTSQYIYSSEINEKNLVVAAMLNKPDLTFMDISQINLILYDHYRLNMTH